MRVLASAAPGSLTNDETFTLVPPLGPRRLDGIAFWLGLPWRTAAMLRGVPSAGGRLPDAVRGRCGAARAPARARAGARRRRGARRLADVDTAVRIARAAVLGRFGDAVAAAAIRRADAVRTVSPFTAGLVRELGVEPAADFPAYMDLEPFVVAAAAAARSGRWRSSSACSSAYKNVDGLAAAWRLAAPRVPDASLHVVGKGTRTDVAEALVRDGARWDRELSPARGRRRDGRRVGARAAVALGGDGPRARRGVLPGPRRRRDACRLDSRSRHGRGERAARRRRTTRRRSPTRSCACSPIVRWRNGSARARAPRRRPGCRRRRSTRAGCGSSCA